jgi:hypothetical protein
VKLPEGVEKVRAKGRTYYYWNPGRKTDREGERVRLPGDPTAPAKLTRVPAVLDRAGQRRGLRRELSRRLSGQPDRTLSRHRRRPTASQRGMGQALGVEQVQLQRPPQSLRQAGSLENAGRQ